MFRFALEEKNWWPKVEDDERFHFRFRKTPIEKLGRPDEESSSEYVDVNVRISGRLAYGYWKHLDRESLFKVVYQFAIDEGIAKQRDRLDLTSFTAPERCPYDPAKINFGLVFELEQDARPIGFV